MSPTPETVPSGFDQLVRLARRDDADPGAAALELARLFQPELDTAAWLTRLDAYADAVRTALPADASPSKTTEALGAYLFGELGLRGNQAEFYDPQNSFLNRVLERRLGIPISLSMLYLALARRLGLQAWGVSFPSHFLVRVRDEHGVHTLDAFQQGMELSASQLNERLRQVYGEGAPTVEAKPALLRAADLGGILVRMLRNLKGIYQQQGRSLEALTAIEGILALEPGLVEEVGDRGLVYRDLGNATAAAADLRRYMDATPDAREAAKLQDLLEELEQTPTRLH